MIASLTSQKIMEFSALIFALIIASAAAVDCPNRNGVAYRNCERGASSPTPLICNSDGYVLDFDLSAAETYRLSKTDGTHAGLKLKIRDIDFAPSGSLQLKHIECPEAGCQIATFTTDIKRQLPLGFFPVFNGIFTFKPVGGRTEISVSCHY